jgi:hypothetical protein
MVGWQNDLNNYVLKSCLEDLRVLDSLGPIDKVTILS